jgi:hypothetical protein
MLPNAEDLPAGFFQQLIYGTIPFCIALYFLVPERAAGLWPDKTLRAFMPEAAVNENSQLPGREDNIRFPGQFIVEAVSPDFILG